MLSRRQCGGVPLPIHVVSVPRLLLAALIFALASCSGSNTFSQAGSPTPGGSPASNGSPASTANYSLSVSTSGSGTVTSSSGGINCGSTCSASYASGTSVTLTASPASGYSFSGWSGGCSGASTSCTVAMTAARNITADFATPAAVGAPVIFYTDIVTGPNTGGENNNGAYLTLFGNGFGATQGTSQVTINDVQVAACKQWSDTKITVQPGSRVTSGAIQVTVSNQRSKTDNIFTVVAGKIFFVALNGNDSTGVIGDINHPFRTIQTVLDRSDFGAGDQLIVRGGTWSDTGADNAFFSIKYDKGGQAGAPIAVIGYPGEAATFSRTTQRAGFNTYASPGYFTIANLHLDAGGSSPCYTTFPAVSSTACGLGIAVGVGTVGVRIVNNEVYNFYEDGGGAATIDGSGKNFRIFGNHLHNNGGSKLYHGIYIDARDTTNGGPNDIEIAYNHVHHQVGGRGIQIYGDTGTLINNVRIHHNLVHHIALDGIILSQDTGAGMQVYNNVVYHTADPTLLGSATDRGQSGGCLRFAGNMSTTYNPSVPSLEAEVYNNTFMDCAADNDPDSASLRIQFAKKLTIRNNILDAPGMVNWLQDTSGSGQQASNADVLNILAASNNLWVGTPPAWDTSPVTGNPLFVDAAGRNYHVLSGSPAIDRGSSGVSAIVTTDYDGAPRPQGAGFDIGAYEQ